MTAQIIVKAILFNKALNRLLLLQRAADDASGADTWENAGGCMEAGESPENAILREIREETGITDTAVSRIAYLVLTDGALPDLLIVYLCETDTEAVRLSFEHQSFVWADEAQCRALLPEAITRDFEQNHIFDLLRQNGVQQNLGK